MFGHTLWLCVIALTSSASAARVFSGDTICLERKEIGVCKAAFPKWYYNATTEKCDPFTFGGCQGSNNQFDSKEECERICTVDCSLPADQGECKAKFPRYYFNTHTRECEEFSYGGCNGNSNNFESFSECVKWCIGK